MPYTVVDCVTLPGTCSNDPARNCNTDQQCIGGGFCRTADAETIAEQACCIDSIDTVVGRIGLANVADVSAPEALPERHLNAKERQEMRELLRQQRLKTQAGLQN